MYWMCYGIATSVGCIHIDKRPQSNHTKISIHIHVLAHITHTCIGYTCKQSNTCAQTYTCLHTYVHIHMHTHVQDTTQTHSYIRTCACTYACMNECTCTCTCTLQIHITCTCISGPEVAIALLVSEPMACTILLNFSVSMFAISRAFVISSSFYSLTYLLYASLARVNLSNSDCYNKTGEH